MRFGICAAADHAKAMAAIGYDYLEGNLAELSCADDSEVERRRWLLAEAGIWQETFNCFFPGDTISLVNAQRDLSVIRQYTARVLERAARLGGRLAVLGSGRARNIPEGMSREEGVNRFVETMRVIGDEAEKAGMQVVLEPLNRGETNLMDTLEEGSAICRQVNHPRVGWLVDLYHMDVNRENPAKVADIDGPLRHVHICRPEGRVCPRPHDGYDYRPFAEALKRRGYDERVTIEANFQDVEAEAKAGLEVLRSLWA